MKPRALSVLSDKPGHKTIGNWRIAIPQAKGYTVEELFGHLHNRLKDLDPRVSLAEYVHD